MLRIIVVLISALLLIGASLLLAQDNPVVPPTELPPLVSGALGIVAPIIAQFVVNRVQGRFKRFLVSILLTSIVGIVSYAIVKPETVDQVDFLIYFYAYASISYQAFWRSLWDSSIPLPTILKRIEGGKKIK